MSSPGATDPVQVHRVTEADWRSVRDLRLEMLRDAPDAFETTYAQVADRTEADWRRVAGSDAVTLQARRGDEVLGTVTVLLDQEPGTAHLVAMYAVPSARGRGVAEQLVRGALDLARAGGAHEVTLEVTSSNTAAIRLYQRCGFAFTGAQVAHPRVAGLTERAMRRSL